MDKDIVLVAKGVKKEFKLPHEKNSSIKGVLINFRKKRNYELQKALKSINLEVNRGEFLGIVGRNGSGKSTLLKVLAGIYAPTKGHVDIRGSLTPFIELGVGFNPELTGRDNVFLNGSLLGFTRKEMQLLYDEIVEFAELDRFMDQKLKNYSSGMQVRLAFSIAIRAKSDILLLDEVLAVGDIAFQKKCFDYFSRLKNEGRTVIFVTHDMRAVETHCTRAILINDGIVTDDGEPYVIAEKYRLLNLQPGKTSKDKPEEEVIISSARINNKHNVTLNESDRVEIAFNYELASKDVQKIYFALSVTRDDEVHVAYFDSRMTGLVEPPAKGKTASIRCSFDTYPFMDSSYRVDVEVYGEDGRLLSVYPGAVSFSVNSEKRYPAGIIGVRAVWS